MGPSLHMCDCGTHDIVDPWSHTEHTTHATKNKTSVHYSTVLPSPAGMKYCGRHNGSKTQASCGYDRYAWSAWLQPPNTHSQLTPEVRIVGHVRSTRVNVPTKRCSRGARATFTCRGPQIALLIIQFLHGIASRFPTSDFLDATWG